ncbi:hypothetical protein Q8A67_002070 [Cirrhinus molitorella]|uniref:SPRY-associated domain-containing protein n=1 Tax=Cirrhinus molitorella TaxID=172907 RepID=A0AA88Q7G9_9TELE|nr:hypothetical protein Q8A67_002070 [Cirrhinus molitorella]
MHNVVPIEEESGQKRIQLEKTQEEIKIMIQDRCKKIKDIKNLAKSNKSTHERNKANKVELFTDLIRSIERCQSELIETMEQKQKAAENQAEELIKELKQDITKLEKRDIELEKLSHTEDHLHLLQVYSSVSSTPEVKTWTNININNDLLNTETLEKALTCLKEKVNKELKKIHEISQPSVIQGFTFIPPTSQPSANSIFIFGSTSIDSVFSHPLNKAEKVNKQVKVSCFGGDSPLDLSTIQQLYAVNVFLDPKTAYPKLILSKDGKQVKHSGSWRDVPNNPERFDSSACVLGRDGYSCGKFYYEVENVRTSHHTPPFFFCSSLPPCSLFFSFPFPELNEWKVPRSTMEASLVGMPEMSGVSRRLVAMGNTPPMTSQTVHSTHLLIPLHFSPPSHRFSKIMAEFKRVLNTDLLQLFLDGLDDLVPRLMEEYKTESQGRRRNHNKVHGETLDVSMKNMQTGLLIGHEGELEDVFPQDIFSVGIVVEEKIVLYKCF